MIQKMIIHVLAATLKAAREFEAQNSKPRKVDFTNPCTPGHFMHAVFEILKGNPDQPRTTEWIVKRIDKEGLFEFNTDTPAASVASAVKRSVECGEKIFSYIQDGGKGTSIVFALHAKYVW